MKVVIVTLDKEGWKTLETDTNNLIEFARTHGYTQTGVNNNKFHRPEIQDLPKFAGLAGPMWDGNKVRYENSEAYAALSA